MRRVQVGSGAGFTLLRGKILTILFVCFLPLAATANCLRSLSVVPRTAWEILIKPYSFPVKIARALSGGSVEEIQARRVEFIKDGTKAFIGYLLYGLVPDAFTLSIVDFHEESDEEFFKAPRDALFVVVDSFESLSFMDRQRKILVKVIADEKKHSGWNVEFLTPASPADYAQKLNYLRGTRGEIARLDHYGHGSVDGLDIHGTSIRHNSDERFFSRLRENLMEKNSVVRINSCLVGVNRDFLYKFGGALMTQGGTLYASKLQTVPSGTAELTQYLARRQLPAAINQLQEMLAKPINLGVYIYLQSTDLADGAGWIKPELDPIVKLRIN